MALIFSVYVYVFKTFKFFNAKREIVSIYLPYRQICDHYTTVLSEHTFFIESW